MKATLVVLTIVLGLSAVLACDDCKPLITKEQIAELKGKATFEVLDYENHPFKDWSANDIKQRLGLMKRDKTQDQPQNQFLTQATLTVVDPATLPDNFDSRVQWPQCITAIRDQKSCGSCWALAASGVLADRFCIAKSAQTAVVLSPQDMVSCDTGDFGCNGGYIDRSWDYLKNTGIVTEECLPYTSGSGRTTSCPFKKASSKCVKGTFKKYKASAHGQLVTINDAKYALMTNGPIEAGFDVYSDFMNYAGGVYKRTSTSLMGGHAVKIVGWGKLQDGTEYWIVANSWNTTWGEIGYFRIAFGECNFETELWTGTPL